MSGTTAMKRAFLTTPRFAVVGASKNQSKFGTKVLQWYLQRNKNVTPVHHKENELEGVQTIHSLTGLPDPASTAVHIITPAKVTLGLLQQVRALNVPAVWLQPGAEDESVIAYIKENGLEDKAIYGGPCVLEEGDGVLKSYL
ncbi:NAD(P)-binding protein [Wolfiporia cocos MD-104 SS10]|uniref:NAD(P)-binding protein n=1 Tax=Wolfiporia cocos (strain MD-104) TaxID=742152 RepID=A0A2H3JEC4_WOLCO|nr:NAD(P)-binding protein [Wolfiporia cocos MD-104 SS10]